MRTIRRFTLKVVTAIVTTALITFATLSTTQGAEIITALLAFLHSDGAEKASAGLTFKKTLLTFMVLGFTMTVKDLIKELITSGVKFLVGKVLPKEEVVTPVTTRSKGSKRAKAKAKARQKKRRAKAKANANR